MDLLPVGCPNRKSRRVTHPEFDFSGLTPEERIRLAEDRWGRLDDRPEIHPLADA